MSDRADKMRAALQKIADFGLDCGCRPCTGSCRDTVARANAFDECQAMAQEALALAQPAEAVEVFNCLDCPVSVESPWVAPRCPECGGPTELDTAAIPSRRPAEAAQDADGDDCECTMRYDLDGRSTCADCGKDFGPTHDAAQGDGVAMIAAERRRQVEAEGWTQEHDDEHYDGALASAAACYASFASLSDVSRNSPGSTERIVEDWPWDAEWWKPGDRIRDLTKAGALIAAEIDRLQRAASPSPEVGS